MFVRKTRKLWGQVGHHGGDDDGDDDGDEDGDDYGDYDDDDDGDGNTSFAFRSRKRGTFCGFDEPSSTPTLVWQLPVILLYPYFDESSPL